MFRAVGYSRMLSAVLRLILHVQSVAELISEKETNDRVKRERTKTYFVRFFLSLSKKTRTHNSSAICNLADMTEKSYTNPSVMSLAGVNDGKSVACFVYTQL